MIATDYIVAALGTMIYNRQGKDSFQGMTCQALLVRNRILAGWESQNWLKLIQDHDKYSGTDISSPIIWGDPFRDDRFRRSLAIANNVYEGREKDIICGATRGCILDQCAEDFANKIVRPKDPLTGLQLHPRVAQVGRWSFFR